MVEGHSVHRVAASHRLAGKKFAASPNGRLRRAPRPSTTSPSGDRSRRQEPLRMERWATPMTASPALLRHGRNWAVRTRQRQRSRPDTTATTASMVGGGVVSHLSAMTVNTAQEGLYEPKRATLGEDPLRGDADVKARGRKFRSKKKIRRPHHGPVYFCGPGNISRGNIQGAHPPDQLKDLRGAGSTRCGATGGAVAARLSGGLHPHGRSCR